MIFIKIRFLQSFSNPCYFFLQQMICKVLTLYVCLENLSQGRNLQLSLLSTKEGIET